MDYVAAFVSGAGLMGIVWYFWPSEKAALQADVARFEAALKAEMANLRIMLRAERLVPPAQKAPVALVVPPAAPKA